jgi:thiol-disulfide isomerase/thioredoxin
MTHQPPVRHHRLQLLILAALLLPQLARAAKPVPVAAKPLPVAAKPLPTAAAPKPAEPAPAAITPDPRWPFRVATPTEKPASQGGVGIVLEAKDGVVAASQVAPGGPAARAGIQAKDVLVAVDGWPIPADAKVPDVAGHIRGAAGTRCQLSLRRGETALTLAVTRAPLDHMFPQASRNLMVVRDGVALLATGNQGTLGVRFDGTGRPDQPLRYQWRSAPTDKALSAPDAQTGEGLITVAAAGAVLQVADWRLDVKPTGDGGVYVQTSNLPVHEVGKADWLQLAPPFASYVKPRTAAKKTAKWQGNARLRLQLQLLGKPLAGRRVTLRLADASQATLDTVAVVADAQGRVDIAVPPGTYRILGLQPSTPGAGRDAAFEADLAPAARDLALATTATTAVALPLLAHAPSAGSVADWQTDPRVGQGLPMLDVTRWFFTRTPPKTLQGQVMLLYVWATWCGPCRATAPMIAEVAARLHGRNLQVVAASIDRDEQALEEYANEELPGAPQIAWVGTEAMTSLEIDSVPTFYVIDGTGKIRGLHRGTGWSVDALEAWLRTLLDDAARP